MKYWNIRITARRWEKEKYKERKQENRKVFRISGLSLYISIFTDKGNGLHASEKTEIGKADFRAWPNSTMSQAVCLDSNTAGQKKKDGKTYTM